MEVGLYGLFCFFKPKLLAINISINIINTWKKCVVKKENSSWMPLKREEFPAGQMEGFV